MNTPADPDSPTKWRSRRSAAASSFAFLDLVLSLSIVIVYRRPKAAEGMEVKQVRAGDDAVKNHHPLITSEYVVAADDSVTSPATVADHDKENFIRVFNSAVDKSVKFDTKVAASFIQKHDFKGLEGYVLDVLTQLHLGRTCLCHHHPGIFCSIYEAQVSYLIREELFQEAENVFNDKAKPLLNDDENANGLYRPSDLDRRVKIVQNCVNNRKQLKTMDGRHQDIVGLLLDYFRLYFPSCSMDDDSTEPRKGSVEDFVVALTDENGVQLTRCLACQWVVPSSSMDQGKLIKHYRGGDIHVKSCSSVTKWMLAYLDYYLQSSKAGTTEIQRNNPLVKSSSSLKKRKSPSTLCGQVVADLIPKCDGVLRAIVLAVIGIAKHKELDMAAVTKGKDILQRQHKLISDLMHLFFCSFMEEDDPLDASVPLQMVRDLYDLSHDLVRLSRQLPSYRGVLTDVFLMVTDLKTSLVLAEVTDPKTGFVLTVAGEFTGTSSSEGTQFSGISSVGSC